MDDHELEEQARHDRRMATEAARTAEMAALRARVASAEGRADGLAKALEPFARYAESLPPVVPGHPRDIDDTGVALYCSVVMKDYKLTFGDFRRARLALSTPPAPPSPCRTCAGMREALERLRHDAEIRPMSQRDAWIVEVTTVALRASPPPTASSPPDDDDPWHAGAIGRIPDDDSLVWRDDATTGPQFWAASLKQAETAAVILNALERRLIPSTPPDWRGALEEERRVTARTAALEQLLRDAQAANYDNYKRAEDAILDVERKARERDDAMSALSALVEALPKCEACDTDPATRAHEADGETWESCDEHGSGDETESDDFDYAVPLRNAQRLLAGAHDATPLSEGSAT